MTHLCFALGVWHMCAPPSYLPYLLLLLQSSQLASGPLKGGPVRVGGGGSMDGSICVQACLTGCRFPYAVRESPPSHFSIQL